uniref:Growth-regulating factor n=1 Tax=Oryza glumipatula TaxID=40148 RepID=A0A0E0AAK8_9ORYZ
MDVFHVTDRLGCKLTNNSVITYIEQSLGMWNGPTRPVALEELTTLELTGADRTGLILEVFAVLADMDCGVDRDGGRGGRWRWSREAYGDGESKCCEKHMHRGKNRSRKPVEMAPSAAAVYRPSALSISPPAHDDAPSYSGGGDGGAPLQLHLDSFHASTSPPPSYHSTPLFPVSGGYGWSSSKEHCLTLGGAAELSLDKPADHHHHDATSATTTEKPLRDDGRTLWDSTQLSISIPTAAASSPDLAIASAASRYHNNVMHGAAGQSGQDAWRRLTSRMGSPNGLGGRRRPLVRPAVGPPRPDDVLPTAGRPLPPSHWCCALLPYLSLSSRCWRREGGRRDT